MTCTRKCAGRLKSGGGSWGKKNCGDEEGEEESDRISKSGRISHSETKVSGGALSSRK